MPSSTDANRDNSATAVAKRMEKYDSTPANKRKEPEDLPRWVKTALIHWAVDGLSYKDAAEKFNRTGGTLSNYAKSPAAKKWLSTLDEFLEDPVAQAKAILGTNALGITVDRLIFLHMAQEAGDYAVGDRIAADLQDRIGITKKSPKGDFGGMTINVSLPGGSVEPIQIESGHEAVEEADWEDEDE